MQSPNGQEGDSLQSVLPIRMTPDPPSHLSIKHALTSEDNTQKEPHQNQ